MSAFGETITQKYCRAPEPAPQWIGTQACITTPPRTIARSRTIVGELADLSVDKCIALQFLLDESLALAVDLQGYPWLPYTQHPYLLVERERSAAVCKRVRGGKGKHTIEKIEFIVRLLYKR